MLRKPVDRGLVSQDRPGPHTPGQQAPERARHAAIAPGMLGRARRDRPSARPVGAPTRACRETGICVRSSVPNRLPTIGKCRSLDPAEEQGRPAGLVDPALDGGDLQVGIDLLVDDDELPGRFQVADAIRQRSIAHRSRRPFESWHRCQRAGRDCSSRIHHDRSALLRDRASTSSAAIGPVRGTSRLPDRAGCTRLTVDGRAPAESNEIPDSGHEIAIAAGSAWCSDRASDQTISRREGDR